MAWLSIEPATAQSFDPASFRGSRMIFIDPASNTQVTGTVGQNVNLATVVRNAQTEDSSFSYWLVSPESAANIVSSLPTDSANGSIVIELLEATTITVTAYGYDQQDAGHESEVPGSNTAVFTINVSESTESEPTTVVTANQSKNRRSALTAANRACSASPAISSGLLATCDALQSLDDPGTALDRVTAEELFAIGDALTTTADNQISNIQSRLDTVRAGNSIAFDISALNLQLWDQHITSAVLSESQTAMYNMTGGSASQDVLKDSATGVFVNGNLSVGKIDGAGIQHDANISSNGLTIGTDYRVDKNRVVGAALGIVNDETDFSGNNGSMDMQGFSLSGFGTWYELDKGYADFIVDISQNTFNLDRRINLPGRGDELAGSSGDAMRMSFSINAGRTFQRGASEFGPVARITMTRASIDGFRESSSLDTSTTGTMLNVEAHSMMSVRFSLGGKLTRVINTPMAVFVPSARVELQVENETDKGVITASFVEDPAANQMQFAGTQRDRTALLISIGTTAVFRHGQSAFLSFESRTLDDYVSQNRVKLGYRTHF